METLIPFKHIDAYIPIENLENRIPLKNPGKTDSNLNIFTLGFLLNSNQIQKVIISLFSSAGISRI